MNLLRATVLATNCFRFDNQLFFCRDNFSSKIFDSHETKYRSYCKTQTGYLTSLACFQSMLHCHRGRSVQCTVHGAGCKRKLLISFDGGAGVNVSGSSGTKVIISK